MSKEVKRYVATRTLPAASEWNSSTVPHTYVRAADYDALLAERDARNELLRGVYPQLCARRDEQDLDDAQQYVLAEECQELIDEIDAALQGEQP